MSEIVNIYDAKARLSQLVDRASRGEEVIVARFGRSVARLVTFPPKPAVRKPGRMRGTFA